MASAIALSERGLGRVWPNPSVACLIVADDRLVARAVTAPGGRPHAEAQALAFAGAAARGATAYVTLEPCAHTGKTPPCADALIAAGVARVVIGAPDPDPRVAGKGVARLRKAGIEVVDGVMSAQAARVNAGYLKTREQGLPLLTLKLATTIDGRIATASGESRWITGPVARARTHMLRSQHDAILVGSGTALADDPALTVRGIGDVPTPLRVLFDSRLRLPTSAQLADTKQAPTWVFTGEHANAARAKQLKASGVKVVIGKGARVDPQHSFKQLADQGITRVFCEGGGTLAAALLEARLVDRIVWFTGGKAIGNDGLPGLGPLALDHLRDAPRFRLSATEIVGDDTVTFWDAIL